MEREPELHLIEHDPDLTEYVAEGLYALEVMLGKHAGFRAWLEGRE